MWPNTVGPACRNTPSVIVNWDPALHAHLAGLQQWQMLPAGPGRDKQIVNFIGQILAILHYSKSAIKATAAGLQSLAQVIGTNGTPVLSILQQVQLDAVGLQVKVSELQIQLKIAEAPYPVGNPSTAAAVQLELNTARPAAAAASAWALIFCHAHDQFSRRRRCYISQVSGSRCTRHRRDRNRAADTTEPQHDHAVRNRSRRQGVGMAARRNAGNCGALSSPS